LNPIRLQDRLTCLGSHCPKGYCNMLYFKPVAGGDNVSHFIYDMYFYIDNPNDFAWSAYLTARRFWSFLFVLGMERLKCEATHPVGAASAVF
jgi:hypothetical protein